MLRVSASALTFRLNGHLDARKDIDILERPRQTSAKVFEVRPVMPIEAFTDLRRNVG